MTRPGEKRNPRGAGLMILREPDRKVLLVRRSGLVTKAGHWAFPGGGVEAGETEIETAMREGNEELGGLPPDLVVEGEPEWYAEGPFFCFATFLGITRDTEWKPRLNDENDDWTWADPRRIPAPALEGTRQAVKTLVPR